MKATAAIALAITAIPLLIGSASAQFIPLPPPFQSNSSQEEIRIAENDRAPPEIQILTTELMEGKNVFEVRITDDSSLRIREVTFVHDGQLTTEGLFRDRNDVYKALIDVHPPARIVEVMAGDANGNVATAFREYDIAPSQGLLAQIMDMLYQIPKYVQNIIG